MRTPPRSKSDALIRLGRKGPIRARDLAEFGIPRTHLRRLVDAGTLEHIARGIYRLADAEPATWTAPTRLTRGLLESHPLQLVLGDEPRTSELFDTLEQAGWGVAPIISRLSEGDHSPNADVSLQQLLVALVGKTLELMPGTIAQTGTAPTAGGPIFPWDCSCITSYGVPKLGPWLPSSPPSLPATGGTLCWWERTYKTRWRSSGDYSLSCWNCTGTGTIDSWPPMYTSTNVLLGEPCVAPP